MTTTIAAVGVGVGVAAGGPVVDLIGARWCFVIASAAARSGCAVAAWLTGRRLVSPAQDSSLTSVS